MVFHLSPIVYSAQLNCHYLLSVQISYCGTYKCKSKFRCPLILFQCYAVRSEMKYELKILWPKNLTYLAFLAQ